MGNKQQLKDLFKLCFPIVLIIFLTAVLSDFSVRMFYSSTDIAMQVIAGILAVFAITGVLMYSLWNSPRLRKALSRIFGMDES